MEHHNVPVQVVYLNSCTKLSPELIKKILDLTSKSLLVGFSLMSKDVKVLLPLVEKIRKSQSKPVVWGGIHPTALPEKSLSHCDFICIGEGEKPLLQLYQNITENNPDYSSIPNMGYHDKNAIKINPVTYSAESLDDIPFPDYKFANSYFLHGFRQAERFEKIPSGPGQKGEFFKQKNFYFYSQRGCRLACTYCSNSLYHSLLKNTPVKWYRYASVNRIKEELQSHLQQLPFINTVVLNDDDLLDRDISQLEAIAAFLKSLNLDFTVNATPSHVTEEKIKILAQNGLKHVAMGIQSGSERILKHVYRRPVKNSQVINAANIVRKFYDYGVRADYGFILDNPYETDDDWLDSLRLLLALPKPRTITLYSLAFFPGTILTQKACEDGFIKSAEKDLDKMYHDDIKVSYQYFLFYINAQFNIPQWLNALLLSDFIVKNKLTSPLRMILAMSMLLLKAKSKIRQCLKAVLKKAAYLKNFIPFGRPSKWRFVSNA